MSNPNPIPEAKPPTAYALAQFYREMIEESVPDDLARQVVISTVRAWGNYPLRLKAARVADGTVA